MPPVSATTTSITCASQPQSSSRSAVAAVAGQPFAFAIRYTLIALLALAMGVQNATARRLAVADMNTTVLTFTLNGIAADS